MTEAAPICRGKNLTMETVFAFINAIPKQPMPRGEFNSYAESNMKGWTQTHSQIARQLALYYEKEGMCYPRFCRPCSKEEIYQYVEKWASLYFIPNPYTPSLTLQEGQKPVNIYSSLRNMLMGGETNYEQACFKLLNTKLSSLDKLRVYINNFTNIYIDNNVMKLNEGLTDKDIPSIIPNIKNHKDSIEYFFYFGDVSRNTTQNSSNSLQDTKYSPYITAIKTKPFLLLAGISGTGKSQKVQELAFMTCPKELRNENSTTPGNYCLIEVKPNWHDSTELLGYYSALSEKYELTDFIRFAYKALKNPTIPFFLCLDEMNLAPVEQYFAEYLSVLETRKKTEDGIKTQPLLSKERFSQCGLQEYVLTKEKGDITNGDKNFYMKELYSESDRVIIEYLKENGLHLPDNLFVIGTVNMDDTTHQFSRKVIDRAFTIEMNGGKMADMFSEESRGLLEYRDVPLSLDVFRSEFVRAYEVLEDERFSRYADEIKAKIPALLGDSDGAASEDNINGILNKTPFRVSYRVQNELVLYLSVLIENVGFPDNIDGLISEATLAILLEKVLPRIQGEQKQLETKGGKSNILKDLNAFVKQHFAPSEGEEDELYAKVVNKLDEMDKKLEGYYTNFF